MTPPVFVVDTNVVVAGLITGLSNSPVASVLDAMLSGSLLYLLSPELLEEYRSVLLRPKLAKLHVGHAMAIGQSGRIVIEIDPELKQELYASLEKQGVSLKQWFLERVKDHLRNQRQPSLDLGGAYHDGD